MSFSRRVSRSRTLSSLALALATTVTAAGCASSTALEEAVSVRSEATTYTRDSIGSVVITFSVINSGRDAVFLPTCGGVVNASLDQLTGGNIWLNSVSVAACFSSFYAGPYRLDPGQTVRGTQSARTTPGTYRLNLPIAISAASDASRRAVSAAITIN